MPAPGTEHDAARRAWFARLARRAGIGLLGGSLLLTAVGGFLHTKAGRPWLARLFGASCPVGHASPARIDEARRAAVATLRGTETTSTRPALGFRLDETTVRDVEAWARASGVTCRNDRPLSTKCDAVPPAALGRPDDEGVVDELAMSFDLEGRLVNVTSFRRQLTPERGAHLVREIAAGLYSALQASPSDRTEGELSGKPLSSTRVSLHYKNYVAEVTAMNLPTSGVAVREHYMSAND